MREDGGVYVSRPIFLERARRFRDCSARRCDIINEEEVFAGACRALGYGKRPLYMQKTILAGYSARLRRRFFDP